MDGWLVQMFRYIYIYLNIYNIISFLFKFLNKHGIYLVFLVIFSVISGTPPASVLCRGLGCFGQFLRHLEMEPSAKGTRGHPDASSSCVLVGRF